MYCVKCGVELSDTEKTCPLCGTVPYHPELERQEAEPLYPRMVYPQRQLRPAGWLFFTTFASVISILVACICDLYISNAITWSGYVAGALLLIYSVIVLPYWFPKPNPILLVPICFTVLGCYLLYISLATDGRWFLSFAFPVVGGIGLITTAMVALVRCIGKGHFFIIGGGVIAYGCFMLLVEFFIHITFHRPMTFWSLFPLGVLCLFGLFILAVGILKPLRNYLAQKLFF